MLIDTRYFTMEGSFIYGLMTMQFHSSGECALDTEEKETEFVQVVEGFSEELVEKLDEISWAMVRNSSRNKKPISVVLTISETTNRTLNENNPHNITIKLTEDSVDSLLTITNTFSNFLKRLSEINLGVCCDFVVVF